MLKLNFIKTTSEKGEFLSYLDILEESLFKKEGFSKAIKEIPLFYSKEFNNLLEENKIKKNKIKEFIKEIRDNLKKQEVLNLKISYSPSKEQLKEITTWVRKNMNDTTILNLEIDESIIAGAVISYKGLYGDYSYKKLFDSKFTEKEKEIRKALNL